MTGHLICRGCHTGYIDRDCPVHGKDKAATDAAARRYTESAREKYTRQDHAKETTLPAGREGGAIKCPVCGVGQDTDGDGDCYVCGKWPLAAKGRINELKAVLREVIKTAESLDKLVTGASIHHISMRSISDAKATVSAKAAVQNAINRTRAMLGEEGGAS